MKTLAWAFGLAMLFAPAAMAQTNDELVKGAADTNNVLNHGMGYNLQRFSTLKQINKDTVKHLVPVWNYSFDDNRSEESQPLVYKGVLYVTTNSATMAIDAKTGKQIWKTKVEYPPETPRIVCCGIINRGAAIYDGKIFRTTLDANVIALDAQDRQGAVAQERNRLQDRLFDDGRAAGRRRRGDHRHFRRRVRHPRLHRRLGSEDRRASVAHLYGSGARRARQRNLAGRHLEARRRLDLDHRLVRSRSCTRSTGASAIPGPFNPRRGRATTSTPARCWRSIPKTGKIKWHFQFSPNDPFDYDAVAEMVLATLNIDGKPTPVLMDANRNGFFYVLDRTNGKLLAANPYVKVNWASGIDMKTGRPIETDISAKARAGEKVVVWPSIFGGKNWEPMSFNPQNNTAYANTLNIGGRYKALPPEYKAGEWYVGMDLSDPWEWPDGPRGYLKAIDPLTGKTKWEARATFHASPACSRPPAASSSPGS